MALNRLLRINVALVLLGSAIAIVWIRLTGSVADLAGLARAQTPHVSVLLALTALSILLRFVRWQYLLRRVGVRLPTRPSLVIYLASLVGTATPGYVGEAVRGVFIRRRFGVPIRVTLFVLVLERWMDVMALALLAGVSADGWWLRGIMVVVMVIAIVAAILARSLGHAIGVPDSILLATRRPGIVAAGFSMSLAAWLLTAPLVGVAASSFGLAVGFLASLRIFSSATLLGGLTLMPAGIGSTGTLAILQLQTLGLNLSESVIVVSLVRLTTAAVSLTVGFTCLLIVIREMRSKAHSHAGVHFNEIAPDYGAQFSAHIWNHLLERKVGLMAAALPPPASAGRGLDLGCGLGIQCLALKKRGYRVFGIDIARKLAEQARRAGVTVANGSALALPFQDQSLDFLYAVGVLHHLPDRTMQHAAVLEAERVLKPGGRFLVHETNPRNPLFRFYMGYVFPVLKKIDEGTEWWIEAERWQTVPGLRLVKVQYFTFLPDFLPAWLMRPFLAIDRWLEGGRLRPYSVHYMAVLERDPAWSPAFVTRSERDQDERVPAPRAAGWSPANGAGN